MLITLVERRPRRKRLVLHLDSGEAISLDREVIAEFRLRAGSQLGEERLAQLRNAQARHEAMAAALRLLAYRPRSEKEMRDALTRRRVADAVLEETVSRLRALRLIDDEAFAQAWVDSRQRSSPRGRRVIAGELCQKGVARETASRALAEVDETEAAYRAAGRKARSQTGAEYTVFRRRIGDLLLRRGFGYDVTRRTVARLWEELCDERAPAEEEA